MSLNISHSCIQTYIPSVKKEYLLCIYAILISFMCALADQNVGDHFCCWDLDRIGNAIFVDFSSSKSSYTCALYPTLALNFTFQEWE